MVNLDQYLNQQSLGQYLAQQLLETEESIQLPTENSVHESSPATDMNDDYYNYVEENRDKIEKAAQTFNFPIEDMMFAFQGGTQTILSDDMWSSLENSESYRTKDLEDAISHSLKLGINPRPYIDQIKKKKEMPLPLILQYGPNQYYLVGGEVILSILKALGAIPHVLVGNITPKKKTLPEPIFESQGDVVKVGSMKLKDEQIDVIRQFLKYAIKELDIKKLPKGLTLSYDTEKARHRHTFGTFNPEDNKIWLYVKNRNLADMLRTLAHELVHRKQAEEGRIDMNSGDTGSEIENEANAKAGILLRNFGKKHEFIYEGLEKFNTPDTLSNRLSSQLYELKINEITLNPSNAVEINGDIFEGEFKVEDIEYEYSIDPIDNPYDDEEFFSISFTEKGTKKNIPTGNAKENYIKILSTMYKIILDFIQSQKPKYIGISSLDKSGYRNIYNNLTKTNKIPGYTRKDAGLDFTTRAGETGKFIVLKRIEDIQEAKKNFGNYLFGDKDSGVKIGWYDSEKEEDTSAEKELFNYLKKYADSEAETYSTINLDHLIPVFKKIKTQYPEIGDPKIDGYIYRGTIASKEKLDKLAKEPGIEEIGQNIIIPNQEYSSQRKVSSWSINYFNAATFAMSTSERKGGIPVVVRAKASDAELFFNPKFMNKLSVQLEEEVFNITNPIPVDIMIIKEYKDEFEDIESGYLHNK